MVSVRLDAEVVTALRSLAEERGVTLSDLLRDAATEFLHRAAIRELTVHWTITGKFETQQGPLDLTEPSATVASSGRVVEGQGSDPLCPV